MTMNSLIIYTKNFREMCYRLIHGGRGEWKILSATIMSYIFQIGSDGIVLERVDSVLDKEVES
jgi:hypothetical protein